MINQKVLASVFAIACLLSTVSTAVINPDPNCLLFDSNGKCLSKPSQQTPTSNPTSQPPSFSAFQATTLPQSQGNPTTPLIETLTRTQWSKDKYFSKINDLLRRFYDLNNFNVIEVKRIPKTDTYQYTIRYEYLDNSTTFRVQIVTSNFSTKVLEKRNSHLDQIDSRWFTPSQQKYINEQSFIKIEQKIKQQQNMTGFIRTEVRMFALNGYKYEITYVNGFDQKLSSVYIFSGYYSFTDKKVDLQIITNSSRSDQMNRFTKAFSQIEETLNAQYNLKSKDYKMKEMPVLGVTPDGSATFTFTYTNMKDNLIFQGTMTPQGQVTVLKMTQKPEEDFKIPPQSSGPEVLTFFDYWKSPSFRLMNSYLRNTYNLEHYDIFNVTREVVSGVQIFTIAYQSPDFTTTIISSIDSSGRINDKSVNKVQNKVKHEGRWCLSQEQYLADPEFNRIDTKLRNDNHLGAAYAVFEVTFGETPWYHTYSVIYINPNNNNLFHFVILINRQTNELKVDSKLVGPHNTPDTPTFEQVDAKVRSENDLNGFTLNKKQQGPNGDIYTMVYSNSRGDTYTFQVNLDPAGRMYISSKQFQQSGGSWYDPNNDPSYWGPPSGPSGQTVVDDMPPPNATMAQVYNSKSFQACFKALTQISAYASAQIQGVSWSLNPFTHVTSYKLSFWTSTGQFEAVLSYDNTTGKAKVDSVTPGSSAF